MNHLLKYSLLPITILLLVALPHPSAFAEDAAPPAEEETAAVLEVQTEEMDVAAEEEPAHAGQSQTEEVDLPAEEAPPSDEIASADDAEQDAPSLAGPVIYSPTPVFDFGEADNSQTIEHEFVIENRGTETLEISNVVADCGCTVAQISSRSIAPGESATVGGALRLHGRLGPQNRGIRISSNDPRNPLYIVSFRGTATTLVTIQPTRINARGTASEPIAPQTINVQAALSHPLPIIHLDTGNPHVQAELVPLVEDFQYRIVLTASESLPAGQTHGNLRIFTESEKYPELGVPYTLLNATTDFIVAPEQIVLNARQGQDPVTRQFVVRPGRVADFQITRVTTPDERIEVDIVRLADGFMVRLRNLVPSPELNGEKIVIETDAEGTAPLEVTFRVVG